MAGCLGYLTLILYAAFVERVIRLIECQSIAFQVLPLSQCPSKVEPQQASLFLESTYLSQLQYPLGDPVLADKLCGSGFQGNSDIYGLGTRIGLYLQLASSVISNQMLAGMRVPVALTYMIFAIAAVIAIFVMSFASGNQCGFSIEIVLLYHIFIGGCLATLYWPSLLKKDEPPKWIGLSWFRTTAMLIYAIFIGYAEWFWTRGLIETTR